MKGLTLATVIVSCVLLFFDSCAFQGPYDRGEFLASPKLRHSGVPLLSGTPFAVRQGAFGPGSHAERGNEFQWDLEVPLGTPVISVDDGVVIDLYQPENPKGGCDPAYAKYAWGLHVEHADGTVAQYLHTLATVPVGAKVKKGGVIGRTVWLGWICYPHVHFGIYRSRADTYGSPTMETLPLYFDGIPGGLLRAGEKYLAP